MLSLRNLRAPLLAAMAGTVAAVSFSVTPASASAPDADEVNARLERACLRIPNLQTRTDNVLERLAGDAETVGSLTWLDERIVDAEARGRAQLAEVLTNRRAVREASVAVFEARQTALAGLADTCAELGIDL